MPATLAPVSADATKTPMQTLDRHYSVTEEALAVMSQAAAEIARLRAENARLVNALRDLDCSDILGVAESCASGRLRWDYVHSRIDRARAAIARAEASK